MVAYYAAVNAIDFYCYLRSVYWRLNISSRLQYRIGYVMWVAVQCVLKSKCISLWLRFFCVCLFISYIALVREMCNVVQHLWLAITCMADEILQTIHTHKHMVNDDATAFWNWKMHLCSRKLHGKNANAKRERKKYSKITIQWVKLRLDVEFRV